MEKNTIERTIEMTSEEDVKSGAQKTVIEIASKHAQSDLREPEYRKITDITEEEVRYAIARLKAIFKDECLSFNEEILVSLTVSVRTE